MICDGSIFSLSPPPLSSLSVSYSLPRHHPPPRLTGGGAISFSSKAQFLMVTRSSAQHLRHLLTSRCSVQEKSSTAGVHSVSPAAAVLRERAKCAGVAAVYVVALRWALPLTVMTALTTTQWQYLCVVQTHFPASVFGVTEKSGSEEVVWLCEAYSLVVCFLCIHAYAYVRTSIVDVHAPDVRQLTYIPTVFTVATHTVVPLFDPNCTFHTAVNL